MPLFPVYNQLISPRVRSKVTSVEIAHELFDLVAKHRQGEAGELGAGQSERNRQIMREWWTEGKNHPNSAVRSQFSFLGLRVYVISREAHTVVCTEQEFDDYAAVIPP